MTETDTSTITGALRRFMQLESAGGLLLLGAAVLAMLMANSPFSELYEWSRQIPVALQVGTLEIDKPLLLWINDGLMAIFFFLVGLEIKREVLEGELSSVSQIALPGIGALGGMLVPAGIYAWMNWNDPIALDGWAIPVATDIAFALAVLGMFGARVPTQLKIFLLTLAIFDDLAAIVIIALFYSGDLSTAALWVAVTALTIGVAMNLGGVVRVSSYVLLGIVLWVALLKSGVHATLAGVLVAFCVPMRGPNGERLVEQLEEDLHGPVAFVILPVFAYANAGISFGSLSFNDLLHPVTSGIIVGLFLGKPLGVLVSVGAAVVFGLARLPEGVTWGQVAGVAFACGIGFTMSLFIAGLAFEHGSGAYIAGDRLGIVAGSVLSAMAAAILLYFTLPRSVPARETDPGE